MTYALADLIAPLTRAECEASIYGVLAVLGVKTTGWKAGGVARAIVTGCSALIAAFTTVTSGVAKSGWLEYATGDWLTYCALYDYGVTRRAATFASGTVTVSNSGGGVYAFDPYDLVVVNATTGKTYHNTAAVSIAALETGVSVAVAAVESGSDSTAGIGQITEFETTYLGLTVTNAAALVGLDEETDTELKIRCQEAAIAASPDGPRDAYSFFAKKATRSGDGTEIGITRVRATPDSETGDVSVVVATASGALSGADLLDAELYLNLYATPLGVTLDVDNAVDHVVPVTYQCWYSTSSGITSTEVLAAVEDALTAFFAARPIGGDVIPPNSIGYVYIAGLRAAIVSARPEIIDVNVSDPSANTAMAFNDIPVKGTVTGVATPVTA